ncbi:hypothetical protein AVEN_136584-1 [Araneus ventricosus]|uniref:Uncharacterized protein n=1 Tax=Araneus ventricosus TaxID=182803 RepID=A0A4Y2WVB5_ARAVE|nr:hypothetical protein AVEN_136584-1 [Araneus ventricosus]
MHGKQFIIVPLCSPQSHGSRLLRSLFRQRIVPRKRLDYLHSNCMELRMVAMVHVLSSLSSSSNTFDRDWLEVCLGDELCKENGRICHVKHTDNFC